MDSGEFVRMAGSAIARTPRARKLIFDDERLQLLNSRRLSLMKREQNLNLWAAVEDFMLSPLSVRALIDQLEDINVPSYSCIIDLLDSIRRAGVYLKSLDLKLSSTGRRDSLHIDPARSKEISSGVVRLRDFSFVYQYPGWGPDVDGMRRLLSACVNTSSLQKLELNMMNAKNYRTDIGDVVLPRNRPELRHILVGDASIHFSALAELLEHLAEVLCCIGLQKVRLLTGDWEQVLELLRLKQSLVKRLYAPKGDKCDVFTAEEYAEVFGEHGCGDGVADLHMRGGHFPKINPLVAIRERRRSDAQADDTNMD
jgi:hypothetical protein